MLFLGIILQLYQLSIGYGSSREFSEFTFPKVEIHDIDNMICNQPVPGTSGVVNPKYIVWIDSEGRTCWSDIGNIISALALGNYSMSLKSVIPHPDVRTDHIIDKDYSEYSDTLAFIRQNCDPSSGCNVCLYNTIGYIEELHPNTPPGNFNIKVTGGVEINISTSSNEIIFPGFSRPVTVGDIWKSSYCVP